ncbi:Glycosyl hydrolase, family 13, all-beta [Trema orientale]|uniref:Glycosyl hydrolase, family 13, all-beta n=1 Tax=Trema orientale TaxID=63057 RepID=A0A2P5EWC1_TREOI|nr:Glycosyl hydrolase, family 13, all-beta [Trema orientale]
MEQVIIQEIEKVDDLNLESKVVVYRTLTKDEKAAKVFLAITGELRRIWLKMEFGNDIFEA